MYRNQILWSPIRVVILSVTGFVQVMLVTFGCFYILDMVHELFPVVAKQLEVLAPGIGLLSLLYPAFILIAMEPPKRRSFTRANPEESPNPEREVTP